MRTYELMLLVRPDKDVTEKQAKDLAQKLAGEGATVSALTLLGKKPLAYPIKKSTEAIFVLGTLAAEALKVGDIEKRVQSEEAILRYLLTQKEE